MQDCCRIAEKLVDLPHFFDVHLEHLPVKGDEAVHFVKVVNQLGVDDGTKIVALTHGDGLFDQFLVFTDQLICGFRQRAIAPRFFGGIPSVPVNLQADAPKFPEGGWDVARVAFVVKLQGALVAMGVVVVGIKAGLTVSRLTLRLIGQPNMARGIDQTTRIELFGQESH